MYPLFSCLELADRLSLPKSLDHEVLTRDLNSRNVFSVWIPVWSAWIPICRITLTDRGWFLWDQKEQRRVWVGKGKEKTTTPRTKLNKWKTMLLLSSTCSSKRVSVKLLPQGDTLDSKVMVDYLKDTRKRFGSLRSDKTSFKDLFLMWDNANPHTSKETKKFLKTSKVDLANQSPYSHDLCDRSLFRKLKSLMKNQSFYDPEDILQAV